MGLLSEGSPLAWEETKKYADHVRKHGIQQFIHQYRKLKDRTNDCLKWGDEVEYMLVNLDEKTETARLNLDALRILNILQEEENTKPDDHPTTWRPEYAGYMIEGTPGKPYGHMSAHFNMVEANMALRRQEVMKLLEGKGQTALSLTAFPRLGSPNFTDPPSQPTTQEGSSRSLFFPDPAIFQGHPRFRTLTRNIRERRKEKVAINIPVFHDKKTKRPFTEDFSVLGDDGEAQQAALPDHIYMDAMGFGMGCSCLQMTFQACNIDEGRLLYDQLAPICPVVLALSAASPIYRGYLSDIDCRWNIIAASVDDRTGEERGEKPLNENRFRIHKSRYDSIDSFLSPWGERYNDIEVVHDKAIYQTLRDNGIDHLLALHLSHLFIRDPVSLFSEKINQNDEEDTDHFENIQSTNWQTMRFKPPPPNSRIGWRVEFRPTEVQLTDFENAAFAVFIVLLTRVILSFQLNFLIPISKVDENLKEAQKRDAVNKGSFYFRKDLITCGSPPEVTCLPGCGADQQCSDICDEYELMDINTIINGKDNFPGLVPLINNYVDNFPDFDVDTRCTILQYMKLISKRASGELFTTAKWMREFVQRHPDYKQDSVVTEKINYDLMVACDQVTKGEKTSPELLLPYSTKTRQAIPKAAERAEKHLLNYGNGIPNGQC